MDKAKFINLVDELYDESIRLLESLAPESGKDFKMTGDSAPLFLTVQMQCLKNDFYSIRIANVWNETIQYIQGSALHVKSTLHPILLDMAGSEEMSMDEVIDLHDDISRG